MPRKIRDAKLRNSRPTQQKRLIKDLIQFAEEEPLIESITIEGEEDFHGRSEILRQITKKKGTDLVADICASCESWDHLKQFVSSYDGKERAMCSKQNNSTCGYETCPKWEKKGTEEP